MSDFVGDDYSASFSDPSYADQTVSIGEIVLQGWEIPATISWGGEQRMTVHKMIGGSRFIDTMGADTGEVSWGGRMLGPDAAFRADQLDLMRAAGNTVDVIFAGRYYLAVISNFAATQITQYHIQYSISFTVLSDESLIFPPTDPPAVIMVASDLTYLATEAIVAPELLAAQSAAGVASALLVPMTAIVAGAAATAALTTAIGVAGVAVNGARLAAEGQVNALAVTAATVGTLAGATTVVQAVQSMQGAAASAYALASAVTMASYVTRASKNVASQA